MTGSDMGEAVMSHEQAARLHQAGKIAEAAAIYEALLQHHPQDAELLTLLGMTQLQLGREEEAQSFWRRSLAIEAPAQARLRTIANMMAVAKSKTATLDFIADLAVPDWPQGDVPNSNDKRMLIVLARGLMAYQRADAACKLLESVLPSLAADEEFVKSAVAVMLDNGHADEAFAILQRLLARPGPIDSILIIAQAAAAYQTGREKEARELTRRAVDAVPVYLTKIEQDQLLLVGLVNPAPEFVRNMVATSELHFFLNTAGKLGNEHSDQYRFLSIFPEAQGALPALAGAPKPQVILNNWVNAEALSTARTLEFITGFIDGLGLPILNHPRQAAETTRQKNAAYLAGVPNLVVPRVIRFTNDRALMRDRVVNVIGEELGFPVIIRTVFAQQGADAAIISSPDELSRYLSTQTAPQLYAIEYVHNPAAQGAYRKMRAAVIGEGVFITHVHFGPRWNVHSDRDLEKPKDFDRDGKFAAYAAKVLSAPEETLGAPAMAALHEIRRRIPLDLYGIDFDILPDGKLLFFEANASMKLGMRDRAGLEKTRTAMRAALRRLFEKAAGTTA